MPSIHRVDELGVNGAQVSPGITEVEFVEKLVINVEITDPA